MSLRARILALVLVATLLPTAALVHRAIEERRSSVVEARSNLSSFARVAAKDLDARMQATSQLLYGLVRASDIDTPDRAACSEYLAKVLAEHPQYTGLLTIRPDASLHCDSLRTGRNLNLADRAYFRQAVASTRPAFELVFGRLTGIAVMQVALASRDPQGKVTLVLLASINLDRFARDAQGNSRYANAQVLVWDRNGTIMAAQPAGAPDKLAGKPLPDSELFRWLRGADDGATAVLPGPTGVRMAWATAAPMARNDTGLRISVGVPESDLTAAADRDLRIALWAFAALLLLGSAGAFALAELGVRRPVARIMAAVARFHGGDLGARIGRPYARGEIGELMREIDATAERAQVQSEQVQRLNEDLERRVAERTAQLARTNAQLEEANRMKSDFLASMSHELRTPLNAIIGFSEMLKEGLAGELEPKKKQFAADILDAGLHLLSLIDDILDLSKMEVGTLRLEAEAVQIEGLLAAALSIVKEQAARYHVSLELAIEPGLPAIAADPRKLKQIVFNLLSNAIKFSPERARVKLGARLVRRTSVALDPTLPGRILPLAEGRDERFIEISVQDTGTGIDASCFDRLFEPFVQIDTSLARRYPGTGLGLALVRRFAELHGGTVGLTSRPGEGSTFSVWIPCRGAATGGEPVPGSAPDGRAEGPSGGRRP